MTSLAILMAMNAHGEHLDPGTVLWTLVISVIGVLLAGLASDFVSHMIAHNTLPSARELRHMLAVASRALGVIVVPVLALLAAMAGWIEIRAAMITSIVALIVSLAVVGRIAVSRIHLPWWKELIVLAGITLLGVVVVFLEQLAH